MKEDLVRMVPDWIPWPRAMVYFTGVCELLGAVGLAIPFLRHAAGIPLEDVLRSLTTRNGN